MLFPVAGPYVRYVKENFRTVAATLPVRTPVYDVSKVLGQMWTNLPAEQKQPFVEAQQSELAELEKVRAPGCYSARNSL